MVDREKVIEGLEHCSSGEGCRGCPYNKTESGHACLFDCVRDALALLKEQEERIGVLTRAIKHMPRLTKLLDVYGDGYAKVVRCKDCRSNHQCAIQFKFADADGEEDWFCADGKRRKENENSV